MVIHTAELTSGHSSPGGFVEPTLPAAWLMVPGDDGAETQVRLQGETLIGRDPACGISLTQEWMSRKHFVIRMGEDGFYLEDLGSANGTYVNEQRVSRTRLVDRDRIRVGGTSMLFIQTVLSEREAAALRRLRLLDEAWHECFAGVEDGRPPDIATLARRLTQGTLREALGYQIQHEIPAYRGIVGYVVEAPMLWIRQTRFPILFVPVTETLTLDQVVAQLQAACATDYLALLVAVPPAHDQGGTAADLRQLVADSVYRYDLAVLDRISLARILRSGDSKTLIEIFIEQGVAPARLSPYVVRGPVPENMFFGREAEIKELSHNLRNHAVMGSRRMGKSSILLRLCRLLDRDPRHRAFYVNCEACFDHADFLATFSAAVAAPAIDAVTGLRAGVTAIARQHTGKTVVFLLDEVDELIAFDARSQTPGRLFKTLRALSHEQISHFVFSGGRTLHDALHNPHSPFFNFCEDVRLSPLSRHNVAEIVLKPMHQLSITLADEQAIIDRVFTVTSGHPNLVQYLCDRLVNQGGERRITLAMVDEVVNSQAFVDHFVETAWSQSMPLEKLITLLPTEATFTRDWLLQRLGERGISDRGAIDSALETLALYSVIQRDGEGLRFVLQHFPTAVRRRDVDGEIAAQMMELEEGTCSSSTAR
jgi:FHA domain